MVEFTRDHERLHKQKSESQSRWHPNEPPQNPPSLAESMPSKITAEDQERKPE
jgi:hypothetical protein